MEKESRLVVVGDKMIVGEWLKDIRFLFQCDESVL